MFCMNLINASWVCMYASLATVRICEVWLYMLLWVLNSVCICAILILWVMNAHIYFQSLTKIECIHFNALLYVREHVDLICMLS
jgi:hypothetical protein